MILKRCDMYVFMANEQALVTALMFTVFSKQANVTYMRRPIFFKLVSEELEFKAETVLRRAAIMF